MHTDKNEKIMQENGDFLGDNMQWLVFLVYYIVYCTWGRFFPFHIPNSLTNTHGVAANQWKNTKNKVKIEWNIKTRWLPFSLIISVLYTYTYTYIIWVTVFWRIKCHLLQSSPLHLSLEVSIYQPSTLDRSPYWYQICWIFAFALLTIKYSSFRRNKKFFFFFFFG